MTLQPGYELKSGVTIQTEVGVVSSTLGWIAKGLQVLMCACFIVSALSGCQARGQIRELAFPFTVIKKILAESLPGGVRKESANGRELTSDYFDVKDLDSSADGKPVRAWAAVTVLGTRRPYDVLIHVNREKLDKGRGTYVAVGRDKILEEKLKKRIEAGFAQRPNDLNVIDDFRAF